MIRLSSFYPDLTGEIGTVSTFAEDADAEEPVTVGASRRAPNDLEDGGYSSEGSEFSLAIYSSEDEDEDEEDENGADSEFEDQINKSRAYAIERGRRITARKQSSHGKAGTHSQSAAAGPRVIGGKRIAPKARIERPPIRVKTTKEPRLTLSDCKTRPRMVYLRDKIRVLGLHEPFADKLEMLAAITEKWNESLEVIPLTEDSHGRSEVVVQKVIIRTLN